MAPSALPSGMCSVAPRLPTWPSWLRGSLRSFADDGAYEEIWKLLLELSFPKDLGFSIVLHRLDELIIATHLAVLCPKGTPIFILSFASPGRGPWSTTTPVPLIYGGRVHHIMAFGLDFATSQAIVNEFSSSYSTCDNIPEFNTFNDHHQLRENWNTSILEPSGYCRFVELVADARSVAGHPWTEMLADLNGCAAKDAWLPIQRLPPLPSPRIRPKDIKTSSTLSRSFPREIPSLNFRAVLPVDVILCIMDWLAPVDLRNLACTSRAFNRIVTRRLWRTFTIGSRDRYNPTTLDHVHDACNALLRVPERTTYVRRLNVVPCTWSWDADLVQKFERIWAANRHLIELRLYSARNALGGTVDANTFTPLIRTLLSHGQNLQLRVFQCADWLRPSSVLHRFLRSQPSIENLVDVDVFASRLPSPDPAFLPNLKSLACDFVDTAIYLMPGRRVQSLAIKIAVHVANLPEFERTSRQTLRPITEADIGITPISRETMATVPQVLTRCFPLVKRLRLASLPMAVLGEQSLPKAHFPHLESLECRNPHLASASEIGDWAWAISPILRSMTFGPDIEWTRSDLDAKEASQTIWTIAEAKTS